MKAQGRSGEGTRFLMTLLDTLESVSYHIRAQVEMTDGVDESCLIGQRGG